MKKNKILKALFFDLDRTLCDTDKANNIAINSLNDFFVEQFPNSKNTYSAAEDYLKGIYGQVKNHWVKDLNTINDLEIRRLKILEFVIKEAFENTSCLDGQYKNIETRFNQVRMESFDFFKGADDLLLRLKKQYTIVVITNGPAYSQHPKIAQTQLRNYVDHIIVGEDFCGPEKPSLEIFQHACTLANCQNSETLHVGDSLDADILGANNSDIISVWIKQPHIKLTEIRPNYVIENICEIESLIDRLV